MPILDERLIEQYRRLHASKKYGISGGRFFEEIRQIMEILEPRTALDFGAGRSRFDHYFGYMDMDWARYDPAIPEISAMPDGPFDLIVCTDVMEHIPEPDVRDVLECIKGKSARAFFNIATREAKQILPNGENAHCTVWSEDRWLEAVRSVFGYTKMVSRVTGLRISVATWNWREPSELRTHREVADGVPL